MKGTCSVDCIWGIFFCQYKISRLQGFVDSNNDDEDSNKIYTMLLHHTTSGQTEDKYVAWSKIRKGKSFKKVDFWMEWSDSR